MKAQPYLTKIRYLVLVIVTGLFCSSAVVHADSGYDVDFRVIDAHNAEIKITYQVFPGTTVITALSSKKGGSMLDGHRDLVAASAQDGSPRTITNNTLTTDSQIAVQSGDQKITLTYKLTNTFSTDEVSLFNFLLFFGIEYPTTAHIKISAPVGYEILSHSGNTNAVISSGDSITTDIKSDQSASFLSAKNLNVLVYPKSNSSYYRKDTGNFTLVGAINKINEVRSTLEKISFALEMFQKILGVSLPDKISIVVTSIKEDAQVYELSGRALPPNIILIDPDELNFSKGPNDAEKIILHELGHLALANKGIFSHQLHNARWFDEGIAVFSEQYATDNYLIKNEDSRQSDTVLSRFKKMTLQELSSEYKLPFDYNFAINSKSQSIDHTYAHAGLIMYNLYLRDATLIPKILDSLQSAQSNLTCQNCDTNTVIGIIQNVSGLQKDEIIYPFKNNLSSGNTTISRLTVQDVDESTRQKIKVDASKALGSYINKDAPVEDFVANGTKEKVTKTTDLAPVPQDLKEDNIQNKQEIPTDKIESKNIQQNKTPSFFERIGLWFINLFK